MKQSIITFAILSLCISSLPSTSAQVTNLPCTFRNFEGFYECFLTALIIPDNEITNYAFTGTHLPGQSHATVERLNIQGSRAYFIIRQAFTSFPNLRVYSFTAAVAGNTMRFQQDAFLNASNLQQIVITGAGLNTIAPNSLAGAPNLQILNLQNNQIASLPNNLLDGAINLVHVNLMQNQLTEINQGFFSRNTNLTIINMNNNQLTNLPQILLSQTRLLTQFHAQSNQINAIGRRFLSNLDALTTLSLLTNACVSQNFVNINPGNINLVHTALQNCYNNYGGSAELRQYRMNLRGSMTLWREDGSLVGTL
ncbi:carboxypeptidase N subunit 2-like [Chironomus tepperi]|uniref:carboxypeptidase N subunit 2-like n=1 Tax=Chironomus tepperi TaxID=113505 RepID=UPI00391F94A8